MNDLIAKAVYTLRNSPSSDDAQVYQEFLTEGIERAVAARLVEFLPMAYCRLLLESSGVRFSDAFCRKQSDGNFSEGLLVSEPIWNVVMEFARSVRLGAVSRPRIFWRLLVTVLSLMP